jgi:putative transposase
VLPGLAHHATQRGVDRCDVFYSQGDRETYWHLLRDNLEEAGVRVLGYCLMTNHVNGVVVPERADSLEVLFRRVHGQCPQYSRRWERVSDERWGNVPEGKE